MGGIFVCVTSHEPIKRIVAFDRVAQDQMPLHTYDRLPTVLVD